HPRNQRQNGNQPIVGPEGGVPDPAPFHLVGGGIELDGIVGPELLEGLGDLLDAAFQAMKVTRSQLSFVRAHSLEPTATLRPPRPRLLPASPFRLCTRYKGEKQLRSVDMHNLTERGPPPASSNSASDQRSLVESATDAIFTIRTDGTLGSLNPAFGAITGWPCEEWLGKPFNPLVHPEDLPLAMDLLARALDGEPIPAFELRILASSGEYLTAEITASPLRDGGRVVGVMGIGRDVTARKRAERGRNRRGG